MMLIPKWGNYPGDGGGGITLVIDTRAQTIARMPDDRRIATLVAFVSRLERTACDDALNLMDLELAKLLTEADREGKAKRKKTLQTFDQAAVLLRDTLLIVLDPTQKDLEHGGGAKPTGPNFLVGTYRSI